MLKAYEKEIMRLNLNNEKDVLKALKIIYKQASEDIRKELKVLLFDLEENQLNQGKIWHSNNQKALLNTLENLLKQLEKKQFETIEEYLNECYKSGFVGGLYALQKQGVPLLIPIDEKKVIKALQNDSKISEGLYKRLGKDVKKLKKQIAHEISRGIASASSFATMARCIDDQSDITFNRAMRIARTEGGRIYNTAAFETMKEAKAAGASCKKRWSAALDSRTRETHLRLDGEVRELEELFSNGLKFPKDPKGKAEEVINCRCHVLPESEWGLNDDETRYIGDTSGMTDQQLAPLADKLNISVEELRKYQRQIIPVKARDYADFRRQYEEIWNYEKVPMSKQ